MSRTRRGFLRAAAATGVLATLSGPKGVFGVGAFSGDVVSRAQLAADPLRPQFHLLPARNWMNDPNGPIYWKGSYHMFFQHNPNAAVWGNMHWAHAVSPDMLHWKHLPMALAPTPGRYDSEGCFSGSAVDDGGTATFLYTGVKSVPPHEATLRDGTHDFLEVQCLATSKDKDLLTWEKLPAPVLLPPKDPNLTGFRDPCLWREENTWYTAVGSGIRGEGGRALLYRSADLRHWDYLHPLAAGMRNGKQTKDPVDAGEMWECPDFFALGKKHVLLYSTERKVYWESGELDPKELVFHAEKRGLLDHGAFYAPKSQLDARGRRILWGWIPETRPEAEFRAAGWAGCMSLPRVLTLASDGSLQMSVIDETSLLRKAEMSIPGQSAEVHARRNALRKIELNSAAVEMEMEFRREPLQLKISDSTEEIFSVAFDPGRTGQELQIGEITASVPANTGAQHRLHVFLDASVAECFVDGQLAWTTRNYRAPKSKLRLDIPDAQLEAVGSLKAWALSPISTDRLTS